MRHGAQVERATPVPIIDYLRRRRNSHGLLYQGHQDHGGSFRHALRDILLCPERILEALPEMIDKTTGPTLRSGFEAI